MLGHRSSFPKRSPRKAAVSTLDSYATDATRTSPGYASLSYNSQNEWAYPRIYGSSHERTNALPTYLKRYNYTRPHNALGKQPPATRPNNVARNYT